MTQPPGPAMGATGAKGAMGAMAQPRYAMTPWRAICGICWALWTVLFAAGGIAGLASGKVGSFFLAALLGGLAGWYDYRIWTGKARRLTLFLIF